jgi:hypothetical protein
MFWALLDLDLADGRFCSDLFMALILGLLSGPASRVV